MNKLLFFIIIFIIFFLTTFLVFLKFNFCSYDLLKNSFFSFMLDCNKINHIRLNGKNWIRSTSIKYNNFEFDNNLRYSKLIDKELVECGKNKKIILLIGQSNAANHVKSFKYKINQSLNLYNNNCYLLTNPVLGASGTNDNISIAISNYLKKDEKYIFLTAAWGGSSILDWGSNKYSYLSSYVSKQLNFYSKKFQIDTIIWIQGETDSKLYDNLKINQGPSFFQEMGRENYYVEAFKVMLKNLQPYLNKKTKIILTKTSKCNSKRSENINLQQVNISNLSKHYFIIENTDNLDNNFRYDKCHLNEIGVDETARSIANIINAFD